MQIIYMFCVVFLYYPAHLRIYLGGFRVGKTTRVYKLDSHTMTKCQRKLM